MIIAGYSEDLTEFVLLGGMMVETTVDVDSLSARGLTFSAFVPTMANDRVVEVRCGGPALVKHQNH
jgi:hypothetical protein